MRDRYRGTGLAWASLARTRLAPVALAALLVGLPLTGCDGLSSFATSDDERYTGPVVGLVDPPVLRRGFPAETTLSLTFDPERATSLAADAPPGVLSTSDGTLTDVALEPIVPLAHDVLGQYQIPAGDRIRNYVFVVRPTEGPLAGRVPMVFLSLMGDGTVEVRIVAGGGSREGDYFGLFRLEKSAA